MKLNQLAAASAIALASVGSYAAAGDTVLSSNVGQSFTSASAFSNTYSFLDVGAGTWESFFNFTGNITISSVTFNGLELTLAPAPVKGYFGSGSFAGGDIDLKITGFTGPTPPGTGIGSYSGVVSVTAIPEPETYAMLLAGLGVIGFIAKRRQIG